MDFLGGLSDKLPGIINPVVDKAIQALQNGEAGALDALKADLAQAIQGGLELEAGIDAVLTRQQDAFFVRLNQFRDDTLSKLNGWKLTSENTLKAPDKV